MRAERRCDEWDLPVSQCGHCRGITAPDLSTARIPEPPAPEPSYDIARRVGRARLSGLAALLQQVVALHAELGDALMGTTTGEDSERVTGGGGDERPMPLQQTVAEHRHLLLRGLRHWAARCRAAAPVTTGQPETVPQLAAYIAGTTPWLPAGDRAELESNLQDWRHGARRQVDLPKLRGSVPLPDATCPAGTEGMWTCGGALRLLLPTDRDQDPWLQCTSCHGRWDVPELPAAANVELPQAVAAELLGLPVSTVWRRAGGRGGTVRLGDVVAQ